MFYKDRELPDAVLNKISPFIVDTYVSGTGWERIRNRNPEVAIYRFVLQDVDDLVVPQNRDFVDYTRRIADVVFTLGEVEKRSALEVLDAFASPSDVLRIQITSAQTDGGTMPLRQGAEFYLGVRKTLLASASDHIEPKPFHGRMTKASAEQFVDSCKIGQSTQGSYVANIICPLDPLLNMSASPGQQSLFPELPQAGFSRAVTSRFMNCLGIIQQRVLRSDTERFVSPEKDDLIISGNFFEGLAEMQPFDPDSRIAFSCSWSPTVRTDSHIPQQVQIEKWMFREIADIAARLRPEYAPHAVEIVGKVYALAGEPGEDELMQGEVGIRFLEDDKLLDARLALTPEDYQIACDAHKLGQYVRVIGTLQRARRLFSITNYQIFEVLAYTTYGKEVNKKFLKKATEVNRRRSSKR